MDQRTAYSPGSSGPAVEHIIEILAGLGLITGDLPVSYDDRVELAVRAFQQQRGLRVDGTVGSQTFRRLDEARWHLGDRILVHRAGALMAGDDVVALQRRLLELGFKVGRADGYFGPQTEAALRDFQRNLGLLSDGTCGPATLKALTRLAPMVRGGSPNAMRASEHIREAGPALADKTIVIDPAPVHGLHPSDPANALILDLASRLEGRLAATGVQAFLSNAGQAADGAERAAFANRTQANLCISVTMDAATSPAASGVATYFFGDVHGTISTAGARLAALIQGEIVARTSLVDLRTHTKSWDVLRRTRMPAVRIDVGYATNSEDRALIGVSDFRDTVAEAVAVAIQRFYLTPETDSVTGAISLSELRAALVQADRPGGSVD